MDTETATTKKEANLQELPYNFACRWGTESPPRHHFITSMYLAIQDSQHLRSPQFSPVLPISPNLPAFLAVPLVLHPRHKDVYIAHQPLPPLCDDPTNPWFYINDCRRYYDEPPTPVPFPRLVIRADMFRNQASPIMCEQQLTDAATLLATNYQQKEILFGLATHALLQLLIGAINHTKQVRNYINNLINRVRKGTIPSVKAGDMSVSADALNADQQDFCRFRQKPPENASQLAPDWVMDYDEMRDLCTNRAAAIQEPLMMYTEPCPGASAQDDVITIRASSRSSAQFLLHVRRPGRFRTSFDFLKLLTYFFEICRLVDEGRKACRKDPRAWSLRRKQEAHATKKNSQIGTLNRTRFSHFRLLEDRGSGTCEVCGSEFKSYFDHIKTTQHKKKYKMLLDKYGIFDRLERMHTLFSRRQAVMAQLSQIAMGVSRRTCLSYEAVAEAISDTLHSCGANFRLDEFDLPRSTSPTCRTEEFQVWRESVFSQRQKRLENILSLDNEEIVRRRKEEIRRVAPLLSLLIESALQTRRRLRSIDVEEALLQNLLPRLTSHKNRHLSRPLVVGLADEAMEPVPDEDMMFVRSRTAQIPPEAFGNLVALSRLAAAATPSPAAGGRPPPTVTRASHFVDENSPACWRTMMRRGELFLQDVFGAATKDRGAAAQDPPVLGDLPERLVRSDLALKKVLSQIEIGHIKRGQPVLEKIARGVCSVHGQLEGASAEFATPQEVADALTESVEFSNELPFLGRVQIPPIFAPSREGALQRAKVRGCVFNQNKKRAASARPLPEDMCEAFLGRLSSDMAAGPCAHRCDKVFGASEDDERLISTVLKLPVSICDALLDFGNAEPQIRSSEAQAFSFLDDGAPRRHSMPNLSRPCGRLVRSNSIPGPIELDDGQISAAICLGDSPVAPCYELQDTPALVECLPFMTRGDREELRFVEESMDSLLQKVTFVPPHPCKECDLETTMDVVSDTIIARVFGGERVLQNVASSRAAAVDAFNSVATSLKRDVKASQEKVIDPVSSVLISLAAEAKVLKAQKDWTQGRPVPAKIESRTISRCTPRMPFLEPSSQFASSSDVDADFL